MVNKNPWHELEMSYEYPKSSHSNFVIDSSKYEVAKSKIEDLSKKFNLDENWWREFRPLIYKYCYSDGSKKVDDNYFSSFLDIVRNSKDPKQYFDYSLFILNILYDHKYHYGFHPGVNEPQDFIGERNSVFLNGMNSLKYAQDADLLKEKDFYKELKDWGSFLSAFDMNTLLYSHKRWLDGYGNMREGNIGKSPFLFVDHINNLASLLFKFPKLEDFKKYRKNLVDLVLNYGENSIPLLKFKIVNPSLEKE